MKAYPTRLFWKLLLAFLLAHLLTAAAAFAAFAYLGPPPASTVARGDLPPPPVLAPLLGIMAAGVLSSIALAWYLASPLKVLRSALDAIANGRFDTRVGTQMGRRRDEVADLGRDFDAMAAQLQRLTETRQQFLHDISHELRSPLSRLQVAAGLLRHDPASAERMLDRIDREIGRMDGLISETLTLARLESGNERVPRERVDLVELLESITRDAAFEAAQANRQVKLAAPGSFVADVSAELIYRALENVIRNAVKFTAPESTVEIRAVTSASQAAGSPHWLHVEVADRGPGVPAGMQDLIFEPFLRAEGQADADGFGLGLSIARRAIESHGGAIEVLCREGGGTTVRMALPSHAPAHPGQTPRPVSPRWPASPDASSRAGAAHSG